MMTSIPPQQKKSHLGLKVLLILLTFVVLTGVWAGMTKAGYIPNYLGIALISPYPFLPSFSDNYHYGDPVEVKKPVIYLYPQYPLDISIHLDFKGSIVAAYPDYNEKIKGWQVTAFSDGRLINQTDNQEYSYLFWEGEAAEKVNWDLSTGFVVKGENSKVFLQQKLAELGLTPKEYNEFIVYWYPILQNHPYNLIHFADQQYTDIAPLTISPAPDSLLRVFMVYKPLEYDLEIEEQIIQPFERKGFAVIEWGGTMAE